MSADAPDPSPGAETDHVHVAALGAWAGVALPVLAVWAVSLATDRVAAPGIDRWAFVVLLSMVVAGWLLLASLLSLPLGVAAGLVVRWAERRRAGAAVPPWVSAVAGAALGTAACVAFLLRFG